VRYADQRAVVQIDPPRLMEGMLSPRALGLVMEWTALHGEELLQDWVLAEAKQPLHRIAPLE